MPHFLLNIQNFLQIKSYSFQGEKASKKSSNSGISEDFSEVDSIQGRLPPYQKTGVKITG